MQYREKGRKAGICFYFLTVPGKRREEKGKAQSSLMAVSIVAMLFPTLKKDEPCLFGGASAMYIICYFMLLQNHFNVVISKVAHAHTQAQAHKEKDREGEREHGMLVGTFGARIVYLLLFLP